jgi:hypothetical protein
MTVVPTAFQLAGWIPAWWRGLAGADDLLSISDGLDLAALADAAGRTRAVTAYCPELGVGALPGPRTVTEAAVEAAEAVVLLDRPGNPAAVLLPSPDGWRLLPAGTSRPSHTDLREADSAMAQAVLAAESGLRDSGVSLGDAPAEASARPLPPGCPAANRGVLVRAVRLWTAVDAVPPSRRSGGLREVLHTAAAAALAAYCTGVPGHDRVARGMRFA